jgi:hypothetical protein
MTTTNYMLGRKKWYRPQAVLFSDTPGTLTEEGLYVPSGYEHYSNITGLTEEQLQERFLILSDHNRSEINMNTQRIEKRQRMINGTMRSYHVADKLAISTSWSMIPSRGFSFNPNFSQSTGLSETNSEISNPTPPPSLYPIDQYTADGGAGGAELLNWYETHTGPFWVFLAYDKFTNFVVNNDEEYLKLGQYNQVIQMYISNFDYSIVKRSGTSASFRGHDLWNINISLEEV